MQGGIEIIIKERGNIRGWDSANTEPGKIWYLITVLARCLLNARSYATYLICIHSFDLPWNFIRNFNSLYRRGNWGTERICDLFEVGRGWSHLTLEPMLLSPAVGKELGNTKCGDVNSNSFAAADPPCDGGIIYPTALNKGYHKFYPSTFPNGLRVSIHSTHSTCEKPWAISTCLEGTTKITCKHPPNKKVFFLNVSLIN